jgi:peptidoglycan/xylan/chitin deacetylase (PgdA/CDA1 family)
MNAARMTLTTRRTVARGLSALGVGAAIWEGRRQRRAKGRALILMYHRVSPEADYLGLCVEPALFEQQIALLRRRARVLRLAEVVARLRQPEPLAEDIAAITFDDGYRDNLEVALPILARQAVTATVFVTTGFVDGTARPAGDRLLEALQTLWARRTNVAAERLGDGATASLVRQTLASPGSVESLHLLRQRLKRIPADEMERLLANLEQLAGIQPSRSARMLDWAEVRRLASQGVEIASHTVSHAILSRLPAAAAAQELRDSKQRLEEATGTTVKGFAYPNGLADDFTSEHVNLLRQLGYEYACTAVRGVNRPGSDPLRLRRIGVRNDSPALLDLKLALGGPVQPCAA